MTDVLAEIQMPDWHDKPSYVHGWNTAMAAVRAALVRTPETLDGYRIAVCPHCHEELSVAASPAPDPGAGLADVAAGRVKPWSEVRARLLAPSAEPPETT